MGRDKKARIDTEGTVEGLGHNPFAGLAGGSPEGAKATEKPAAAVESDRSGAVARVARTRKGGWPLSLEKRSGGKVMTILRQVEGDSGKLLKLLRKQCGAGGVVREDQIEIQGDHQDAIKAWLDAGMPGLND